MAIINISLSDRAEIIIDIPNNLTIKSIETSENKIHIKAENSLTGTSSAQLNIAQGIRDLVDRLFEAAPEMQEIGLSLHQLYEKIGGVDKDAIRRVLRTEFKMLTTNGRYKFPESTTPGCKIISNGPTSHYIFKRNDIPPAQ